jgi:hypothetical protein
MAEVVERHPEEHPEAHEQSDVNVRALAIAMGVLFAIIVVTCIVMYAMFQIYERQAISQDKAEVRTGIVRDETRRAPPQPVPLQGIPGVHGNTPAQDLRQVRRDDSDRLHRFVPHSERGFVQIPIDRAMELVVERDLIKRQAPAAATTQPTTRPREGGGDAH